MKRLCYIVAGLPFEVALPAEWNAEALLPEFDDFRPRHSDPERHAKGKNLLATIEILRADATQDDAHTRHSEPESSRHSEAEPKNLLANIEILRAKAAQDDAMANAAHDDAHTRHSEPQAKNLPAHATAPVKTLSETIVDAGHLTLKQQGDTYIIDLEYDNSPKEMLHSMLCNGDFQHFTCYVNPHDNNLSLVITSFLRIAFAQAAIAHKCISIHSSCVVLEGKAYLFLGKSGTGKSTHARQWMSAFAGCTLLNDDNPVIRIENGVVMAYGTPWSGKTPCYKNENYPVAGIVRLSQAKTNKFTLLSGTEAFAALLPSCSSIRQDKRLQESLIGTLIEITETVPVGRMECLPDTDAAKVCYNGLHIIDN